MRWSTGIILFVDGDNEVSRNVSEALGVTDYIILHAATAQEADSVLSRLNVIVDLLVVDLELPDGAFGLLTSSGCRKASTVIAKTYRQDNSFLRQVRGLGVDAVLLKPTSAEQLVGTMQAALSGCPKWFG